VIEFIRERNRRERVIAENVRAAIVPDAADKEDDSENPPARANADELQEGS
jgi:hypothetical protein